MHDIADLESRGIPSAFVATVEFITAAEAQSASLGLATARVFTPHPVQDRTDAEMVEYADSVFDEIVSKVTRTP